MSTIWNIRKVAEIACTAFLIAIAGLVIIAMLSSFCGCSTGTDLGRAFSGFQKANPGVVAIPVDKDGDGTPEFYAPDADADGKADKDASGATIEIPGTRAPLGQADASDAGMAEIFDLGGALAVGTPFAAAMTLIGAWWGKRKPIKQITQLVAGITAAKEDNTTEGYMAINKEVLETYIAEKPGLLELIESIRAAQKVVEKKKA